MSSPKDRLNTAVKQVRQICAPLFQSTPISYFEYARKYNNGRCFNLSSNIDFVEFYTNHEIYQTAPPPLMLPGQYLWKGYINNQFISETESNFNLEDGLTIIRKYEQYDEIINFASETGNYNVLSLYLNQFDLLEHFISYFLDKADKLIQEEIKKPSYKIQIPDEKTQKQLVATNELLKVFNSKKFNVKIGDKFVSITKRESQCLAYLLRGLSAKQIARKINISYRTVEIHCDNIRRKTQCGTRLELLSKIQNKHLIEKLALEE